MVPSSAQDVEDQELLTISCGLTRNFVRMIALFLRVSSLKEAISLPCCSSGCIRSCKTYADIVCIGFVGPMHAYSVLVQPGDMRCRIVQMHAVVRIGLDL